MILMSVFKKLDVTIDSLDSDEDVFSAHCRTWRH
jgi:hypothetical protein